MTRIDRRTLRTPLKERLERRLVKNGDCLEWTGCRNKGGYGQINRGGKGGRYVMTHRAAYELAYGPIPKGLDVLHSCDNPPCCNVEHLRLGTDKDNAADRAERNYTWKANSKAALPRGERHHNAKLTDAQRDLARQLRTSTKMSYREIGDILGVSWSCIYSVIHPNPRRADIPNGETHWNSKLSNEQRREIFALIQRGVKHQEIAVRYGIHRRTVGDISRTKAKWKQAL